jgi:hypothetical protein
MAFFLSALPPRSAKAFLLSPTRTTYLARPLLSGGSGGSHSRGYAGHYRLGCNFYTSALLAICFVVNSSGLNVHSCVPPKLASNFHGLCALYPRICLLIVTDLNVLTSTAEAHEQFSTRLWNRSGVHQNTFITLFS